MGAASAGLPPQPPGPGDSASAAGLSLQSYGLWGHQGRLAGCVALSLLPVPFVSLCLPSCPFFMFRGQRADICCCPGGLSLTQEETAPCRCFMDTLSTLTERGDADEDLVPAERRREKQPVPSDSRVPPGLEEVRSAEGRACQSQPSRPPLCPRPCSASAFSLPSWSWAGAWRFRQLWGQLSSMCRVKVTLRPHWPPVWVSLAAVSGPWTRSASCAGCEGPDGGDRRLDPCLAARCHLAVERSLRGLLRGRRVVP